MRNMQLLLLGLERERPGQTSIRWRRARMGALLALGVVVALGLCLGFAALSLYRVWETSDWFIFWFSLIFVALFASLLTLPWALFYSPHSPLGRLRRIGPVLREAAAGDDRLAPVAAQQPALLAEPELSPGGERIGPLQRSSAQQTNTATVALIPFVVIALLLIPLMLGIFVRDGSGAPGGSPDLYPFVGLFELLFIVAFVVLVRAAARHRIYVTADARGIAWRKWRGWRRRTIRVPWHEISAYFALSQQHPLDGIGRTTYFIAAHEATLSWALARNASDEEFAAAERLSRVVATRTRLPLRDLSALARELAQTGGNVARALSSLVPTGSPVDSSPAAAAMLATAAASNRTERRVRVTTWVVASAVMAALVLLAGAGGYLAYYQQQYFASLPAQLHGEGPLYAEPLAYYAGAWPVHDPTPDDPSHVWFAAGDYRLTNTANHIVFAWLAGGYGDAAVEVTARQLAAEPVGSSGHGVGVSLRARGTNGLVTNMVVFLVDVAGRWTLWRYNYFPDAPADSWHLLASGHAPAIHTGVGAANRLLVVARGRLYIGYVNDHLVATYFDESGSTLLAGQVGVFVDNGATTGSFNDFAIYAMQPATAPWYV